MCTSPIELHVRNSGHLTSRSSSYLVPCGKCDECTKAKQLEWCVRMIEQVKDTPDCFFITLTYAPDKVPVSVDIETGECFLTVCKKHVQDWMKRLKIRLTRQGRDFKVRPFHYFITSEYGSKPRFGQLYRPHYHAILFGISFSELFPSIVDWRERFGFVSWDNPRSNYATIRYCSKYCAKGSFENPHVREGKVLPTFHLVSHGLGAGYLSRMRSFHLNPANNLRGENIRAGKVNLYYSKKYVEYVADNLFYADSHLFDKYGNKAFKIKLPKYYKDRILGRTVYIIQLGSGKRKAFYQKSELAFQVADFLLKRRLERDDREREQLVRQGTCQSISEAFLYQAKEKERKLNERAILAHNYIQRSIYKQKI